MKNILNYIAILISLTCAIRTWQFNVGIRINIFDVLQIAFITVFVLYSLTKNWHSSLNRKIVKFIKFLFIWLIFVIISDISAIFWGASAAIENSIKGILITTLYSSFFIVFSIYFSDISNKQRMLILNFFVFGVALSVIYSFVQFYGFAILKINFDSIIWPAISYNFIPEEKVIKFDMIYRLAGFTGEANTQGLYILMVLPLLSYKYLLNKNIKNFLTIFVFVIAFSLTLSRSATLALFLILFLFSLSQLRNISLKKIISFILFLTPIILLAFYFHEEIQIILKSRNFTEDNNRSKIYEQAIGIFETYPTGIGYNNYSVYRLLLYGPNSEPNAHNSWLTILVEIGIHGLLFYFLYLYFLIKSTFKSTSDFAIPFRYGLLGLLVAVTFNQTLNLFYVQYFIVLFFLAITYNLKFSSIFLESDIN